MISINHTTIIKKPVQEVFNYVTNSCNDPEWCEPVKKVEQIGEDKIGKGTKFTIEVKPGPKSAEGTFVITEFNPYTKAAYEGEHESATFNYNYKFEPVPEGTKINMISNFSPKGFWKILTPIIKSQSRKATIKEFENLKRILEKQDSNNNH